MFGIAVNPFFQLAWKTDMEIFRQPRKLSIFADNLQAWNDGNRNAGLTAFVDERMK